MKRSLALVTFLTAVASANGRFPATTTITFGPNPGEIYNGATFGLLLSKDSGQSWNWICEKGVGYTGYFDPVYAVTSTGTILAGIYDGLAVSRDGGCSFTKILPEQWISDVQIGPDGAIWIATANTTGGNDVLVSRDDAMTFTPTNIGVAGAWWKSIRVAPTDAKRLYVAGYEMAPGDGGTAPVPLLYRSDDAGATWVPLTMPMAQSQIRIAGVSPTDENLFFVRVDGDVSDLVLRSPDAGTTLTTVLTVQNDNLTLFVPLADGKTFLAGSPYVGGDWISTDGGLTWNKTTQQPEFGCGKLSPDGTTVYACAQNWKPDDMALGKSTDGQTWTKVMRFPDIMGPISCAAGTPEHDVCGPAWGGLKTMLTGGDIADASVPLADAETTPPPPSKKGCGGCGVGLGLIFLVVPPIRARRRR